MVATDTGGIGITPSLAHCTVTKHYELLRLYPLPLILFPLVSLPDNQHSYRFGFRLLHYCVTSDVLVTSVYYF
jgi:hypothetical protein